MTVQQRRMHTLVLVGASLGLGCGLEEIEGGGEGDEIPAAVQAAFNESCATSSGCHAAGASVVILAAPESAAILTATSSSGGGPLVSLGDLEGSYIAQKILGGPGITGASMPPAPQSSADDVNKAIIIGWIAGVPISGEGSGDGDGDGDGDGNGDGDGDGDVVCYVAAPIPTVPGFAADIWPILENRCGFQGCHANASAPLMPDASAAYDNIVSIPAAAAMANYVEPDDPGASYLWHKLAGTYASVQGGGGGLMPIGGALCGTEFQAIYAWILAGAAP